MPLFKIYRMREAAQQQFRWAPHTGGATLVRPRDYVPDGEIEAASAYAAWASLRDSGNPLRVGDIVEIETGQLRICKYVGFEEAHWQVPEVKPAAGQSAEPAPESAEPEPLNG